MEHTQALKLQELLTSRATAALGTLLSGAPYVSMVPFALLADGSGFVIHVSGLATHTKDMLADPRVSLLIAESEQAGIPPQALPRVTVLGRARQLTTDSHGYAGAREAYLKRLPDSAPLFDFGDFSLFLIEPEMVRWVAGFAQARSLGAGAFADVVRGIGGHAD